jgi:dTDP-4-amino-4,6-dideoxygalactose transaminase
VISLLGAVPVFVDIDPRTFNMDPGALAQAIGALRSSNPQVYPLPRHSGHGTLVPRGIIAVDLFGLPADYGAINQVARDHGLFVIEDAAQSFGAELGRRRACSLADLGSTSFYPAKPLGCYGEGGMCFTNDDKLAESVRSISLHGKGDHKYDNVRIGINGRLDTLQAAVLLANFEVFREEIDARQDVAARYGKLLAGTDSFLTPQVPEGTKSAWSVYSLVARGEEHRGELQKKLRQAGIPHAVYYPKPLHLQPAFRHLGYREGDFPISEDMSKRIFSIPMHPYLSAADQQRVAQALTG